MSNRFHLAIPVRSIEESKKFYCDFLGCDAGSFEDGKWQDINFWGNELSLHHFGVHFTREDFDLLKSRVQAKENYDYLDQPYLRFKGDAREQETFFVEDPSGTVLEIKTMFDPSTLFPAK